MVNRVLQESIPARECRGAEDSRRGRGWRRGSRFEVLASGVLHGTLNTPLRDTACCLLASRLVHAAGQRVAIAAAAVGICFSALFFAGGFDDAPLVWIGGLALLAAAVLAAATLLGVVPAPRPALPSALLLGGLFGLAVWAAASTLWSISPDRSWTYSNRTLVYAAFALLGFLLSALVPRLGGAAAVAAALLGAVLGWALLAKCVPALYPDYGRVARLRAPVVYWNELALLCDVAVPLALWLAVPRTRRASARAAGVLLLFAATVVLLLTYSRVGVALACVAAVAWLRRPRPVSP